VKIKEGVIKRIHVNQHNVRHNKKNPDDPKPIFTVKHTKGNEKGNAVHIYGPSALVRACRLSLSRKKMYPSE